MPSVSKVVNKDLQEERDKVKFATEEFANWFYDGPEKVKEKREIGMKKSQKFDFDLFFLGNLNFPFRELLLI